MKIILSLVLALMTIITSPLAQETAPAPISTCMAVAQNFLKIIPASASVTYVQQSEDFSVRVTYIGHSTFRLETPGGVVMATDFTGEAGNGPLPRVVTMNHAHTTHFTVFPDPAIEHVLRGWGRNGEPAKHFLTVGDTLVRNVTTDINSNFAGYEPNGNSIFIFETAGLCIGHLGHLHHLLTDGHYAQIGRLDILMVPVDGGLTMGLDPMIKVVRRLNASVVLPMHWFSGYSLAAFLDKMKGTFPIQHSESASMDFSLRSLPEEPTIIVLPPATSLGRYYE